MQPTSVTLVHHAVTARATHIRDPTQSKWCSARERCIWPCSRRHRSYTQHLNLQQEARHNTAPQLPPTPKDTNQPKAQLLRHVRRCELYSPDVNQVLNFMRLGSLRWSAATVSMNHSRSFIIFSARRLFRSNSSRHFTLWGKSATKSSGW